MPVRSGNKGSVVATDQTTQYNTELDDGYYKRGLPKSYDALTTGQYSGTTNIKLAHYTAATIAFVQTTLKITDSANGLAIFKTGDSLWITGAVNAPNNTATTDGGNHTVGTGNVAGEIVLNEDVLMNESAGATVTIAKRESHSNNCVYDHNTGLMWSTSPSDKMGTASNGLMPWTGQLYDIFAYAAAANTASLAGYADWRVPNLNEWGSLFVYQGTQPYVNTTYFTGTMNYFWISTTDPATSTSSLWAYPQWGAGVPYSSSAKTAAASMLLVRGG